MLNDDQYKKQNNINESTTNHIKISLCIHIKVHIEIIFSCIRISLVAFIMLFLVFYSFV